MQLLGNEVGSSKASVVTRLLLMAALGGVLASAMVLPVVAATGVLVRNTADKVTATSLTTTTLPQRSAIYDRNGHLITYVYGVDAGSAANYQGIDRQPVGYDQISPRHDEGHRGHRGRQVLAARRHRLPGHAARDRERPANDKPVQGGSTIDQQYVKDVLVLSGLGNAAAEKAAIANNLSRKYTELRMALDVAHKTTKPQILDGYLNDAYFEQGAWGIEAASETYFGVRASKLSLTQAALLAGIVENPSAYDPVTQPASALGRRNIVLAEDCRRNPPGADLGGRTAAGGNGHAAAGPAPRPRGERLHGRDRRDQRVLLRLRDAQPAARRRSSASHPAARAKLLATGGLKIYTTVNEQDQAGGDQRGELRAARTLQDLQPGAQRRE